MQMVEERSTVGGRTSYTRGNDLSGTLEGAGGIGGLLARSVNGGSHAFYHADGNGNVTAMVDGSQAVVANYRYDPYGRLVSSSGTLAGANLMRFSSKSFHGPTGFYYYGYRFYDPQTQRWVNRDPIAEAGGSNLYRFVRNDPRRYVDPLGLAVSWLDVMPGIGTFRSCRNKPGPYTPHLDKCQCETDPLGAEIACERDLLAQALRDIPPALYDEVLQLGVDAMVAGAGLAVGMLFPPAGVALEVAAALDTFGNSVCNIWFGFKIRDSYREAANACKCPTKK
jgi:RHS repeat-associated protein